MRSQVESDLPGPPRTSQDLLAARQHRVGRVPLEVLRLRRRLQVLGEGGEALAATERPRGGQGSRGSWRSQGCQGPRGSWGYPECQGRWPCRRSRRSWGCRGSWGSRGSQGSLVVLRLRGKGHGVVPDGDRVPGLQLQVGVWTLGNQDGRVFQTRGRPITDHPTTTESEGLTWRGCTVAA